MPTRFFATLCACVVLATPAAAQPNADCELTVVLEGGDVYDGRGSDPVATDVGILDDRVVALGELSGCTAARRLDVTGLAVVPRGRRKPLQMRQAFLAGSAPRESQVFWPNRVSSVTP